jgi:citrate lyase gamma subunit
MIQNLRNFLFMNTSTECYRDSIKTYMAFLKVLVLPKCQLLLTTVGWQSSHEQRGRLTSGLSETPLTRRSSAGPFGFKEHMITIRPEQCGDIAAIRAINEAAFGQSTEATIVDSLRDSCPDVVSLVAVEDKTILGHIFFSPVLVCAESEGTHGMGLAPMAVLPER